MVYYRHTMDVIKKKLVEDMGIERYNVKIVAYERKRKAEEDKKNSEKARVKAEEEEELRRRLALKNKKCAMIY